MDYRKEVRDQNSEWFAKEVLPHEGDVRAWLRSKFPTLSDADDIIQEAYFRLMKAHTSGPLVNPRAYLFVMVKNLVISRFRHLKYERPSEAREMSPLEIVDRMRSPSEEATASDDVRLLIEALKVLPERCCQVMTLRKIYGFSQKEVAQRLGISVNTVQVQTRIGLKKCSQYFRKIGYRRARK